MPEGKQQLEGQEPGQNHDFGTDEAGKETPSTG
jgi:hypothetical protein